MSRAFHCLTRGAIRGLNLGESITEHGITYTRSRSGDGVFSINIMVDGQRIHRVVGRVSDGTTRTHAEKYIEKLKADARAARLNLPKGRKVSLGFRVASSQYLQRLKAEGGKDLKMKEQRLRLHLDPFFGDRPLSQITTHDVDRYKQHRLSEFLLSKGKVDENEQRTTLSRKTKPGTVNRELATLSHLLSKAMEWEWIERMPLRIRRLQEGPGRTAYLSSTQAAALLESARKDSCKDIYPFVLIGLHTAMRRSEILQMRREHINVATKQIQIPEAKAGARVQPITEQLADYLAERLRNTNSDWVFPANTKSGRRTEIRKAFARVVLAAGLDPKKFTPHGLRHTAISHLVMAGVDLTTVARISGHKTLIMVQRYAHQDSPHVTEAMQKLSTRYGTSDT